MTDNIPTAYHVQYDAKPTWYQENYADKQLSIAFFCMEYMLTDTLPIYSGGLGNVAGDLLKTASDLGLPLVGIGLLYQQGYFRQVIQEDGKQIASYPNNDISQMPITPLRDAKGDLIRLQLKIENVTISLRVWLVRVGRINLYLLDSNDDANPEPYRSITRQLYDSDISTRCLQEIILGLGGWLILEKIQFIPDVCHFNEGHTAFAALARIAYLMRTDDLSFDEARKISSAGNVFTTHTAVAAGFDLFPPTLIAQFLTAYAQNKLGINVHALLGLGRINPNDTHELFNMAYLAIRCSNIINGVSQLHREVSKELFAPLFKTHDNPIIAITNGVHIPTWASTATAKLKEKNENVTDTELWRWRVKSRETLLTFIRKRCTRQHIFNAQALTIGFARRFTAYKRGDLLLQDEARLIRILTNPARPVQLVLAGKAHPADLTGQAIIQKWVQFCQREDVQAHVIFLADYNMSLAQQLVQGVDLWLNTPRRPWEACGTSGMKALINGGIHFSELDGWWAEAYHDENGWALGDGEAHTQDEAAWDKQEADMLYTTLEEQIVPAFYTRDENDLPKNWVKRMRASLALTPQFSAMRMMKDYLQRAYVPAANNYHRLFNDTLVMRLANKSE